MTGASSGSGFSVRNASGFRIADQGELVMAKVWITFEDKDGSVGLQIESNDPWPETIQEATLAEKLARKVFLDLKALHPNGRMWVFPKGGDGFRLELEKKER